VKPPFRCTAQSLLRDDDLAGTASTVRAFLLVENPGPWGVDALRDNRLPAPVKTELRRSAGAAGVRVLLIRRHHRRAPREDFRVFAAYADPVTPWVESARLHRSEDLLSMDLEALAAGRSMGLARHDEPLFCVCTHGRHDACCAERGRPVAAVLSAAHREETWEVSHLGGDRFAANVLVIPDGLYYGRLDAVSALTVTGAHTTGRLDLDHLRGRSGLAMPVQAAEIGLRHELAETGLDTVRFLGSQISGPVPDSRVRVTVARFAVAGTTYDVEVQTSVSADLHRLTCDATRDNPIPNHEVVAIRLVGQTLPS
jgi:hypothetical protein